MQVTYTGYNLGKVVMEYIVQQLDNRLHIDFLWGIFQNEDRTTYIIL